MELVEDQRIESYANRCLYCTRNTLLPYEYEWTCVACGYNVVRRNNELRESQRKTMNPMNRLKYAENKIICLCIDGSRAFDGGDIERSTVCLTRLKIRKLHIKKITLNF